jgi:serine/threonine protein kinase
MSGLAVSAKPVSPTRALRVVAGGAATPHDSMPIFDPSPNLADGHRSEESFPTVCPADIIRDDLTGLSLGQYALGKKVGDGGMGTVFLARHRHLDRLFAIKFVSAELSNNTEAQDRFERETLALGKLQHPHIVNAVDAGCVNGLRYLVTEFIEGEDLARLVERRGLLPVAEACELIRQAADGLEYSHANGFVHRDIKPSNLIVNKDGVVKILDFGLVQNASLNHRLTDSQELLGTWDFLAPEQAQDASQVDRRSDIYSLGCTLIFLLSGEVPFSDSKYATAATKLKGHLFDTPSWLQNPPASVPRNVIDVLIRMVAKSPSLRFQTASEVVAALEPGAKPAALKPAAQVKVKPKPDVVTRPARSFRSTIGWIRFAIAVFIFTFIFVWPGIIKIRFGQVDDVHMLDAPVDGKTPVAEESVSSKDFAISANELTLKDFKAPKEPVTSQPQPTRELPPSQETKSKKEEKSANIDNHESAGSIPSFAPVQKPAESQKQYEPPEIKPFSRRRGSW